LATGGQLCAHDLVHQTVVALGSEGARVELGLGGGAQHGCVQRGHQESLRISTTPPIAPGTAPLINSRFFSASTSTTDRPRWVTRSWPMWPAIFMPLNTRAG